MKSFLIFIYALLLIAAASVAAVFSYLNYYETDNVNVDITDNIIQALSNNTEDLSSSELDYIVTLPNDETEELPETGVKTSTTVKVMPQYPKIIECNVYQYNGPVLAYLYTYKCDPVIIKNTITPTITPTGFQAYSNGIMKQPTNIYRTVNMMLYKTNTQVSCFLGSKFVRTEYYTDSTNIRRLSLKRVTYEVCIKNAS